MAIITKTMDIVRSIKNNDIETCKKLISEGVDPLSKFEQDVYTSLTPLKFAIGENKIEIVKKMLTPQIIDRINHNNNELFDLNALEWACECSREEIVEILLERGVDVCKGIPLVYGARKINIVELLLKNESLNVNKSDPFGYTALHYSVFYSKLDVAKILLDQSTIKINKPNIYNHTPLYLAVSSGNAEMIQLLMYNGADPSIRDKQGNTPLSIAKEKEIIELLEGVVHA